MELVARVREVAARSDGLVTVLPGVDGEKLNRVTGEALVFLREVGGWTTPSHLASFAFAHPDNYMPLVNDVWPLGDAGDHWILDTSTSSSTWYAYVDPDTREWGRIFRFGEDPIPAVVAPDFSTFVDSLVTGLAVAVGAARGTGEPTKVFRRAWIDWVSDDPASLARQAEAGVTPVTVAEARASDDPVVADVAGQLPADGYLADLRTVAYPSEVDFASIFPFGEYIRYHHLRGATFLGATVIPDE